MYYYVSASQQQAKALMAGEFSQWRQKLPAAEDINQEYNVFVTSVKEIKKKQALAKFNIFF